MVFTYFKRAKFTPEEFNTYNFFLALYLASDIEEDIEEYKYEIFPWALGSKWRSKFSSFLRKRDDLLKRIGYRAIVSRKSCEEVMNFIPDHFVWKRERAESHGGAVRGYLINKCRSLLSHQHRIDEEDLNMPRGPSEKPRPCPLCTMNNTLSIELNPIKYLSPAIHSHQKFMPTPSSVRSIPVQFPGHPHHHHHYLLSHSHHHHHNQYLMNSTSSLRSNATTTDSEDNCLFNSSTSTSGYETCSSSTTNTNSSVIDMNNNNLSFSNLNYESFFMPNQSNNKKATVEENKENHQSSSELKNDSFVLDTTLIDNASANIFKQPIGAPISGKNLSKQQKIKYPSVTGVNNYFIKDNHENDDSAASDDEDADDVFSKHNSTSVILTKSQQHAASLGSLNQPQRNSSRATTASSRKSTKTNQSTRRRQHYSLSTNAVSTINNC
jgi:speedy protein